MALFSFLFWYFYQDQDLPIWPKMAHYQLSNGDNSFVYKECYSCLWSRLVLRRLGDDHVVIIVSVSMHDNLSTEGKFVFQLLNLKVFNNWLCVGCTFLTHLFYLINSKISFAWNIGIFWSNKLRRRFVMSKTFASWLVFHQIFWHFRQRTLFIWQQWTVDRIWPADKACSIKLEERTFN